MRLMVTPMGGIRKVTLAAIQVRVVALRGQGRKFFLGGKVIFPDFFPA